MKKYEELTSGGVKRRLRKVVQLALIQYDINVASLDYFVEDTNLFYTVVDDLGKKYALKIFQEESSTIEDNLAEVYFIDQVQKCTDIVVPAVVPAKSGEKVMVIHSEYTPAPKRIALYEWIEGVDLDGKESPELFYKLGQMTARLHEASEIFIIPKELSPKKWDNVFYYNEEVPVYKEDKYQKYLNKEYHEVMDFIIPYLNKKLAGYYCFEKPQLIHADLNPWNVKIYRDQLRLLDFEEAMLAYPVHDLAIVLFYYRYNPRFNYEEVKKSYFDGYESIRCLPKITDFDLELLMTARRVNFLNYVLQFSKNPAAYIIKNIPRVQEFIKTYI